MNSDEATVAVIDALQTLDIPYILVGSLASNLYGIPRSTKDADFSVQVGAGGIRAIVARLGSQFRLDPQVSFETVTGTMRYVVNVAENPYRIEFFCMNDDPFARERFARRQRSPFLGRQNATSRNRHATAKLASVERCSWVDALETPLHADKPHGGETESSLPCSGCEHSSTEASSVVGGGSPSMPKSWPSSLISPHSTRGKRAKSAALGLGGSAATVDSRRRPA